MKQYQFVIRETGTKRNYKSLGVCKYQAMRYLKSLVRRGLIFGKPEIEFYSIENGIRNFIPCDFNSLTTKNN